MWGWAGGMQDPGSLIQKPGLSHKRNSPGSLVGPEQGNQSKLRTHFSKEFQFTVK